MISKILNKLSHPEYELFLAETGAGTNSRKIAAMIRKNNAITRDEIFKRIFRKKRDTQNDYLLRNEISILKKRIEKFILENTITDISRHTCYYKPYVMAQWCLKKSLTEEAEKYLHDAIQLALGQDAWKGMLQINKLLFQTSQYSKSDYQLKLELLNTLAENHIEYLKNYVAEEARYADFMQAGAFKLASNLRNTKAVFKSSTHFSLELRSSKSKVAHFYHLKSLAYAASGNEAIEFLEKAIVSLDEELEIFLKEEERLSCMSAMAMEYAVTGDFKKAAVCFEKVISHQDFMHFTAKNSLIFNYCTTLLKLREYEKAILYLEDLEKLDIEPIVKERIYTMKCNCYIFMENLKEIKKMLPRNLQSFDLSVRIYYRFLYVIYYLIKQDYEFAERELVNIGRVRGFGNTDYAPLLVIFGKYTDAFNAKLYEEKDRVKKLSILKEELNHLTRNQRDISLLLPGMWIVEKSSQLIEFRK